MTGGTWDKGRRGGGNTGNGHEPFFLAISIPLSSGSLYSSDGRVLAAKLLCLVFTAFILLPVTACLSGLNWALISPRKETKRCAPKAHADTP